MKKIITTVGTSMFTNYISEEGKRIVGSSRHFCIEKTWRNLDFNKGKELDARAIHDSSYKTSIDDISSIIKDRWFVVNGNPNENASAEITSIIKAANGEECEVSLLATDTLRSVLAAELIRDWFEKFKEKYHISAHFQRPPVNFQSQNDSDYVVKDLQVFNFNKYKSGFQNLFYLLKEIVNKPVNKKDSIYLNITGGYKAIIPPIILFAQLKKYPVIYLFEGSRLSENQLITIAGLPFGFDYSRLEGLIDYLSNRELREAPDAEKIVNYLRQYKLIEENSTELTPIGELMEAHIRQNANEGKTMFGYIAELLLYEYYAGKGYRVERGRKLNDKKGEDPYEIDLVLTDTSGEERWIEVKPLTECQIKKAKEQLEKRLNYKQEHLRDHKVKEAGVIFYKPQIVPIERYVQELKSIFDMFASFKWVKPFICYFDIQYGTNEMKPGHYKIAQNGIEDVHEFRYSDL